MARIRGGRFSASNDGWAFPIGAAAAAGVGIQSIQHESATILSGNTYVDVTITAVDLTKTFVTVTNSGAISTNLTHVAMARLTSATNLRIQVVGTAGDMVAAYTVVELAGPATVQYGYTAWDSTSATAAITAVDLAKTFLVTSWNVGTNNGTFLPRVKLTTTNVQFTRIAGVSGSSTFVAWFVVEFTG